MGGNYPLPPRNQKFIVEKWWYFRRLFPNSKKYSKNNYKVNFSIDFSSNFQSFLKISQQFALHIQMCIKLRHCLLNFSKCLLKSCIFTIFSRNLFEHFRKVFPLPRKILATPMPRIIVGSKIRCEKWIMRKRSSRLLEK